MDLADDAAAAMRDDPFAVDPDAASKVPPGHEFRYVRPGGPSLASRRRRVRAWSTICALIGVPLLAYSSFILAKGSVPSNEPPGAWWIWLSVAGLCTALALLAAVFRGKWWLARTLALVLMAPGSAMFLLLVWAMGLGLLFLPSALVWLPVAMLAQGMPAHEQAAQWSGPATRA